MAGAAATEPEKLDTGAVLGAEFEALRPGGTGPKPSTMAAYLAEVHKLPGTGRSALCLSGGGIRSAAFSLGVVQGLARRGLLSQMDYLSTVSGGGYTGSWLVAWAHRAMRAARDRATFKTFEAQLGWRSEAGAENGTLTWLRQQQKYLSPRSSIASGDLWAPVSIFLQNLLLNWLVFLPMLAGILLLPWVMLFCVEAWSLSVQSPAPSIPWIFGMLRHQSARPGWMDWSDTAAAVLVSVGFGIATFMRTARGQHRADQQRTFRSWVLPLVLGGSFVLVLATGGWIATGSASDRTLWKWAVFVPTVLVAGRLVVAVIRPRWPTWRMAGHFAAELLAIGVSGTVSGLLIWAGVVAHESVQPGGLRLLAAAGVPWLLMSYLAGQVVFAGLTSRMARGTSNREWLARASGYYLLSAFAWLLASGTVLYGYSAFQALGPWLVGSLAVGSGTFTLAMGLSAVTKATSAVATAREWVSFTAATRIACLMFCVLGAILLAHATVLGIALLPGKLNLADPALLSGSVPDEWAAFPLLDRLPTDRARLAWLSLVLSAAVSLALLLVSMAVTLVVNVNAFSLHSLYANRLIRTFLGASNRSEITGAPVGRDLFDGFADADNLAMAELWTDEDNERRREGPYPVLGIALNLVGGSNLAWQERKAAPFVVTPLHTGGDLVGYRPTAKAGGGITLGTAMAISGAAASPNFGYHSSPLVSFVLMLFNVRLGWWLGNPAKAAWKARGPLFSLRLFQQEALGQTSAEEPYVYLSDGGHFDNLGLYEMLRRRCRTIVVVDGTADVDCNLEDLGRALRTAFVDLGISVRFDPELALKKRSIPETAGVYCALGVIDYPEEGAPAGRLVYVKAGLHSDAPADVRAYAATNAKFPHDSTSNQFFTESQFESYRALGSYVVSVMCRGQAAPMTLQAFIDAAADYVKPKGRDDA